MSVTKAIEIDGKEVLFKASAAIPRLYRCKFKRDIFTDLMKLESKTKDKNLDIESLECFENLAYIMAYSADSSIGDIDKWLDGFSTFSIYQVLPQILDLWGLNTATLVEPKKKIKRQTTRPFTVALFMLRAIQLGLSVADLENLTIGLVNDMFTESLNDDCKYAEVAQQSDFDNF